MNVGHRYLSCSRHSQFSGLFPWQPSGSPPQQYWWSPQEWWSSQSWWHILQGERERGRERVQLTQHGATTINKGCSVFLIAASCKVSAVATLNWLTDTRNEILQTALLTTCHLAVGILSKTGVQYGVWDLVTYLVCQDSRERERESHKQLATV